MELMKKFNPFKRHQLQQQFHHQQQLQQLTSTSLSQRDSSSKKKAATEKELVNLNQKIEKLLANLDENQVDGNFPEDEECVVCLSAKATMKTYPCGHRVVCRKCFVKTIQTAVAERCLPLKCVVCRTKILKLKQPRLSSSSEPLKHLRSADRVDEYRRCQRQQQQILLLPQHNPSTGSSSTTASAVSAAAGPANPVGASSTSVAATGSRSIFSSLGCAGTQRSGGHHHHQPQQPQQQHHQAAGSTGAVKPTATRLMQPLLIYPSQGTGDWRRHGTVGWPSRDDSPMPRTADTTAASAAAAAVPATAGSRMFNGETRPSSAATRRRTKHPVGIDLQH